MCNFAHLSDADSEGSFVRIIEENNEEQIWSNLLRLSETGVSCSRDKDASSTVAIVSPVPLIAQNQHWDCGLACVVMALQTLGKKSWTLQGLHDICPTKSVWTIDLAHLLSRCGVRQCVFTTTQIGVNPDYCKERFYAEHMPEDALRVNTLFEEAQSLGIHVERRSLSIEQLEYFVKTKRYLVIMLIDKRLLLTATSIFPNLPSSSIIGIHRSRSGMQLRSSLHGAYTGHYVLVHGFDTHRKSFLVKDPSSIVDTMLWVSESLLDAARRAYGTDEDMIFVPLSMSHDAKNL